VQFGHVNYSVLAVRFSGICALHGQRECTVDCERCPPTDLAARTCFYANPVQLRFDSIRRRSIPVSLQLDYDTTSNEIKAQSNRTVFELIGSN